MEKDRNSEFAVRKENNVLLRRYERFEDDSMRGCLRSRSTGCSHDRSPWSCLASHRGKIISSSSREAALGSRQREIQARTLQSLPKNYQASKPYDSWVYEIPITLLLLHEISHLMNLATKLCFFIKKIFISFRIIFLYEIIRLK